MDDEEPERLIMCTLVWGSEAGEAHQDGRAGGAYRQDHYIGVGANRSGGGAAVRTECTPRDVRLQTVRWSWDAHLTASLGCGTHRKPGL